jgi:hypothetical protein
MYTEFRRGVLPSRASKLRNSGRMRVSVLGQALFLRLCCNSFFKFLSALCCDAGREGSLTPDEERILLFVFVHESQFIC